MQQPLGIQTSRVLRSKRTQPALPGAALPTSAVYVSAEHRQRWPQFPVSQHSSELRGALLRLCLLGCLLGLCALLLYPLAFAALPGSGTAQALTGAFPWLERLFWTNWAPFLVVLVAHVSWLDLRSGSIQANLNMLLLVLVLAYVLLLLAVRVCWKAVHARLSNGQMRTLLLVLCAFTLFFGGLFIFLPGGQSQEILLSGLYGRLIALYHINPYLVRSDLLVHDPLYLALKPGTFVSPLQGPLWLDLTVFPGWLTQGNPAFVLLVFRVFGLFLHLVNALLIWAILAKIKPEARLSATLFYAWNPAFLLLGVSELHAEMAVICFLLLGTLFLQRHSILVGWACLLLAALINPLSLVILPLFLRVLAREMRGFAPARRTTWWIGLFFFSVGLVIVAYAPFWSGLGLSGIALRVGEVFWPDTAQHSLLVAFANLPFSSWAPAAWLLTSHHWLILPALLVGGMLLLGVWITDNLELALLFSSWIFLALIILWPTSSPWDILLPLALALASSSRRTSLLAHLLTLGAFLSYSLIFRSSQWNSQALITIGLPVLIWGWTLFFLSTWDMTHYEDEEAAQTKPLPRRSGGLSRPSWPSRPAAWPSRPGQRDRSS